MSCSLDQMYLVVESKFVKGSRHVAIVATCHDKMLPIPENFIVV